MTNQVSKVSSKLTPTQLQQRVIHLQSELNKYKALVEQYQNNYHYNLIDTLQEQVNQQAETITLLEENLKKEKKSYQTISEEFSTYKHRYDKKLHSLEKDHQNLQKQLEQSQQKHSKTDSEPAEKELEEKKEVFPYLQSNEQLNQPDELNDEDEKRNDHWFYKNFTPKK
ncbi:hypothetical protein [Alkalihalobacillus trypoxylicola]|uniref:Uncharacterized protein n=1 Tax=Alkalihalobacillus trypoxylicola TaxID=519424 RepID=A0A162EF79_9BACI|nr:hypothetical protein [Alkalihalobacillus trypoxylicola]KYG32431.1 hypothetical protein AZF04_06640 [Alkalihalobacillus trypoxylicola]